MTTTERSIFSDLRRLHPISRSFGLDRGQPIDRFYIESFLSQNRDHIRGRVLEVADNSYTTQFGDTRVTHSDILHSPPGGKKATLIGDLTRPSTLPPNTFDCIILTQVLPFIFDVQSAITQCHRALRPTGTVLATLPGISQISRYDMDRWGDYWRFTTLSATRLFEPAFGKTNLDIQSHGNVLAAIAFLQGLCTQDLTPDELAHQDDDYQLLITVRATKPGEQS